MEDLLEAGFNLARDGKLRRGLPSPLQFAVMADEFRDEIGLSGLAFATCPNGPRRSSYSRMRLLCELHGDGPQRMADLASALDVTPRNVTTLVDGLEREGIVQRRPHPTDRRATVIELTDSAHGAVDRSMEHEAAIGELFEKLAPTDRATLIRLIGDLESRMGPDAELAAP